MTSIAIFDFDNTIVHSQIDFLSIRRDITQLLRDSKATEYAVEQLTHLSIGQIIAVGEEFDAANGTQLGPQAWQIVLEYERQGMLAATIEPDAAPTLQALRDAAWTPVLLTNNARLATLDALRKFELEQYFDLVLTRDEVPMKPAPGGIQHAINQVHATRTVMVGDAWLDGQAAENAGVPFVAFGRVMDKLRKRDVAVWWNVERLGELVGLLGSGQAAGE
jgi:phosphoglycolate phosphatase